MRSYNYLLFFVAHDLQRSRRFPSHFTCLSDNMFGLIAGSDIQRIPSAGTPFNYVYDILLPLIVLVCLPLCILTLLTTRLLKAMKAHRRMQADMQRQHSQTDSSMTFSLVIVIIVFIICRAPLVIFSVMSLLDWLSSVVNCYTLIMYYTLHALNSAVNFIIYITLNGRFRSVLLANVCRRRSAIPEITANTMTLPERVKRDTFDGNDTSL